MKHIVVCIIFIINSLSVFSQDDQNPVLWSQEIHKISDTEYELIMKGKIADEWHVYSQFTPDGGALPTFFTFENVSIDYELVGDTEESETFTAYSDIFEVNETFFKKTVVFSQKVKLLEPSVRQINVNISYQVCKEVCILGDNDFHFVLDGTQAQVAIKSIDTRSTQIAQALKLDLKHKNRLVDQSVAQEQSSSSIWGIFGLGFLGGLIALLTPCVFPMIPLTVSFFTKQSQKKSKGIANALLYGFFIVLIYFLLSLPFHVFDSVDSQILNTIATNVWLNVVFFIIFVGFAFSFFGYFELRLPNSWANTMDDASSRAGGVFGIFFMAVTLAIVSFSCTGPILGGLLGSTALANGDMAINLSAGMLGFGTALALPFGLFALFPTWLNSLPKSGGWMNTVKVVLGFLELILAIKFLSNADLVGHWGIFKRELFIGIWIVLFVLLALYLLGAYRFPHDSPKQKIVITRKFTALLSIFFATYLFLGVFKVVNLKLFGFLPPDFYTIATQETNCPLGLNCFKDFDEGLAYAKTVNKPILVDFTGWACVNCRKMEENVWSEPDIYPILKENYVLISLYVDDRKELSEKEQFNFKYESGRVKTIRTIGQKWGTFQTLNFNAASQPYYVLLSPNLEVLNTAVQYTDRDSYLNWLKEGLKKYKIVAKNN